MTGGWSGSTERPSIVIIGTGFAGIGMAIRLKQAGIDDFVVLEQSDSIGGTWRDNHYPGAACDVESHLYSFSFEPNPGWTRTFAPQGEILAYLNHCADKYGVRSHIRCNAEVTAARFDEESGTWEVRTRDGQELHPRIVVSCCGGLSRPATPDLPGLARFTGKVFHSARWDDSYPLAGKRVAVIGTGASAIQIVPAIASQVGQMFVYQRTPPWIMPKLDRAITPDERERFRQLPMFQKLARLRQYVQHELLALGFVSRPRLLKLGEKLARRYMKKVISDPVLRERLTPRYALGCKRILISNDYYPAIQRPNVELVTDGIQEIRESDIVSRDGRARAVDAIILATGFQAAEAITGFSVRGRGGRELNDAWRDGPEAFLGTSVTGFPNLFFIVGPNTGLGHSSMIYMIESQLAYVMSCVKTLRERRLKLVDVRPEVQARYNAELQARFPRTIWSSGCVSWYMTRSGKNTTLWPGFTFEFRMKTRRCDPNDYELVPDSDARS